MLVSELKTALKRFGFDDSDPLLIWLNAAYHEIEEEKDDWSFLEITEEISQTTGDKNFVPAKLLNRPIKLLDITDTGTSYEVKYMDRRTFLMGEYDPTATGRPEVFYRVGDQEIEFWPKPEKARKFLFLYIRELEDLKEESEIPAIPVKNHFLIAQGAAYIALQAENEEDRAANAENQFRNKLERMVISDNEKQVGEVDTVEDVMEYGD